MGEGMGPCAKTIVTCVLQLASGPIVVGRNDCFRPQAACPREPGEGYEKCRSICRQPYHAETAALAKAEQRYGAASATGAKAFIHGIGHVCRDCQERLFAAGVESFSVVQRGAGWTATPDNGRLP